MIKGPRNRTKTQIIQDPWRMRRSLYRLLSYSETREKIRSSSEPGSGKVGEAAYSKPLLAKGSGTARQPPLQDDLRAWELQIPVDTSWGHLSHPSLWLVSWSDSWGLCEVPHLPSWPRCWTVTWNETQLHNPGSPTLLTRAPSRLSTLDSHPLLQKEDVDQMILQFLPSLAFCGLDAINSQNHKF